MSAPALIEVAADPMAAVCALNKMRLAGFALSLEAGRMMVEPASRLSDSQRAFLKTHKPALVALLQDAETLHTALVNAGASGLGWMAGTPGWDGTRLLAAGEVLYASGQMVNREDRRYLAEHAPPPTRIEPPTVAQEAANAPAPVNPSPAPETAPKPALVSLLMDPVPTEGESVEPAGLPTPAVAAVLPSTPRPLVCRWDRWGDRLVMKCADPEPNADKMGCANCGAKKTTAAGAHP